MERKVLRARKAKDILKSYWFIISMLVGMITASTGIIRKSEESLTSYYAADADMASAGNESLLKKDSLKFVDKDGSPLTFAGEGEVSVSFYTNRDARNTPVISYEKG